MLRERDAALGADGARQGQVVEQRGLDRFELERQRCQSVLDDHYGDREVGIVHQRAAVERFLHPGQLATDGLLDQVENLRRQALHEIQALREAVQAVETCLESTPRKATHWSVRRLSEELGYPRDFIHRVWRAAHTPRCTPWRPPSAITWHTPTKTQSRFVGLDIETCGHCGGALRIIASIEDPSVIKRILEHLARRDTGLLRQRTPATRAPPPQGRSPGLTD